jgi:hypothetical protein
MATTSFFLVRSAKQDHAVINVRFSWKRNVTPFRKSLSIEIPVRSWDKIKKKIRDIAIDSKYRENN